MPFVESLEQACLPALLCITKCLAPKVYASEQRCSSQMFHQGLCLSAFPFDSFSANVKES